MMLFGASGHCKSVIDIALSIGLKIISIYDDNPKVKEVCQIPVVEFKSAELGQKELWVISVGDNFTRKNIQSKLKVDFGRLIHNTATISSCSEVNLGTVVMAKAVVNACTTVGSHCIINTGAIVEHDCKIADFVHISPNSSIAGGVTVGEGTHVGIGACVLPGIKIGKWATIGAGAVIIKDVPDGAVVVGNPGKIIKYKTF